MLDSQVANNILGLIDEGIIIVDREKTIKYIKKKAMNRCGLDLINGIGHPSGHVEPGDIAIICCNAAGLDTEILSLSDLELIGVNPQEVNKGDSVIAIGKVGASRGSAIVETKAFSCEYRILEVDCLFDHQIPVKASVNEINNRLSVTVFHDTYEIDFQKFNNTLVIVSPDTKQVKFYQTRGYSLRGEAARDVLKGKPYAAKGSSGELPVIVGSSIDIIRPDCLLIQSIERVLSSGQEIRDMELCINTVVIKVSIFLINNFEDENDSCVLVLNDISDISDIKRLQQCLLLKAAEQNFYSSIIGSSENITVLKKMAYKVSRGNSTVLLLGESGTGKGLFAKAIHNSSKRAEKSFVAINMASIPENLLESELFGYEEGAFTGARKKGKPGKFLIADKGTTFLDEIGDMKYSLQAKLLQVLQEGCIYPVGSVNPIQVDVRIIAATNRKLEEQVEKGLFREDLYYRLNVVVLELPPLRDRKEDIKELIHHLIPRINKKLEKNVESVEPEVYHRLLSYDWPGNIRELENVLESAINLTEGKALTLKDIPARFVKNLMNSKGTEDPRHLSLKAISSSTEKQVIDAALEVTDGNRTETAILLNISRTALYNKLKKYGLG